MQENQLTKTLQTYGLICHTVAFDELETALQNRIRIAGSNDFENCYLSLIANGGNGFWQALRSSSTKPVKEQKHPVDEFSLKIAKKIIKHSGLEQTAQILYPGEHTVPLMELGKLSGWSMSSPLGLGLHPEFGPWLAYRALIKTDKPLQVITNKTDKSFDPSVCLSCVSTPCVNACPADAVELGETFSIKRCADYRITEKTTCERQCHARNACPVGTEHRYSEEQQAYHMERALMALVAWSSKTGGFN